MTLSADEVRTAYRLFLNREPEDDALVERFTKECAGLAELRDRFIGSEEFQGLLGRPMINRDCCKPLIWPPNRVEVEVSDDVLDAMVRHVEANWTELGVSEPHWSVLSDDRFLANRIAGNEDDFYGSGRDAIEMFEASAQRVGVDLGAYDRCFELGCGLGRLTLWLSRRFGEVVAADISPSHLQLAAHALNSYGRANVRFLQLDRLSRLDEMAGYDVAVSIIVLQHNPPPVIAALVKRLLAKLNPGGVAYFQLSTYHVGYRFEAARYLKTLEPEGRIEMHVLPQRELFELIAASGCELLEIREDSWAGQPEGVSNSLLVRKQGRPPGPPKAMTL